MIEIVHKSAKNDHYYVGMTPKKPFNSIIFDLDGTLFDTWPSLLSAAEHIVREECDNTCGGRPLTLDAAALRSQLSLGLHAFYRAVVRSVEPAATPERIAALSAAMGARWAQLDLPAPRVYAGVFRTLQTLSESGVRLGVCTNRDRESSLELLCATGLEVCFEAVVTCDDVPEPKPAAIALNTAMLQLGAQRHDTLFVGDSLVDALSARNSATPFAAHRRGYATSPDDLNSALFQFNSYSEFLVNLQRQAVSLAELRYA